MAEKIAIQYGLRPAALKAQISAESGWNPRAVSYVPLKRKGRIVRGKNGRPIMVPCAYGLAQFIPSTGKSWGLKNKTDLFNPVKSLHAMGKLMSSYVRTYKRQGNSEEMAYRKAYIAYNCGPGCLRKGSWVSPNNPETTGYIRAIKRYEVKFKKQKPAAKGKYLEPVKVAHHVPVPGGEG